MRQSLLLAGRGFGLAAAVAAAAVLDVARVASADEIVVEGKRVVVRSTVADRAVAERCRETLEAAIPVYEKNLPYRMPEGERLVLRLYGLASEYAEAVTAGGAPSLAKNLAGTLAKTKESHVVLQPRADPAYLALVGGLPEMTRFLVCHEGVHQFLRRAGAPGCDLWPDWYAEGMADFVAQACLADAAGKGAPVPIHVDDKRQWVQEALAHERVIGLERLLFANESSFRDLHSVYAHWEEFYRFLSSDDARMKRLHDGIRREGLPGESGSLDQRKVVHARACADVLAQTCGPLAALEEAWKRQTKAVRPVWFEEARSSQRVGDEIVCASFPDGSAVLLSAAAPPGKPFALSCEVNLLALGTRQADLCFGYERREDPRFVKIALGADGYATLLAYGDGSWQDRFKKNADVSRETIPTETWIPVRVAVDRATIRVEIGGRPVLDAAVPPGYDVLGGSWGIGVRDGVARFRKIEVRAEAR